MPVSEQLDSFVRARVERARAEVQHSLASIDLGNPLPSEQDIVQLVNSLNTKALLSREETMHTAGETECLTQLGFGEPFKRPTYGLEKQPTQSQTFLISARS